MAWSPALPVSADEEEQVVLQKYLAHLYLNDSLETVKRIYPPTRDWPSHREPKGGVTRIKVQGVSAKNFPDEVDLLWVGMRDDRVVEIQLVYDADYTSETPPDSLARELALIYAQVPALKGRRKVVEMRTSMQLLAADLVRRKGE
jgi:hypothetical protein